MERNRVRAGWAGCLAAVLLIADIGAARAETIITSVLPGSRRVDLTWMRAAEDSFHTAALDTAVAHQNGYGVAPNVPDFRDTSLCVPLQDGERLFRGYKIWRKAAYDPGFILLRKIGICDTLYTFGFRDLVRRFVDPDSIFARVGRMGDDDRDPSLPVPGPFDGFDYEYSVTGYEVMLIAVPEGSAVHEVDRSTPEEAAWGARIQPNSTADPSIPFLDRVRVVPNPFVVSAAWSQAPKIQFQNLPQQATVRIYTTAGDLVRILRHDGGVDGFGSKDWDLKNGDGRDVMPGIYLFHVTTRSGEETKGQFVVIR